MEGKVTEGKETGKLIGQSNARFIYMSNDIPTNYDQSEVRECASEPGKNTFKDC